MKIVHIISGGDTGGAKTHVLTLLRELKNKVDCELICIMEGNFVDEARKLGLTINVFKQKGRYDIQTIMKIRKYILNNNFKVIHSHGARANYICTMIRYQLKIPLVTTIHSDYRLDFIGNKYKKVVFTNLNYFFLKRFKYYIAVTNNFKNMLVQRGFDENSVFITYNGVDMNSKLGIQPKGEFLTSHNIPNEDTFIYVGMVARLDPVKGIDTFLQAINEINKTNDNIIFIIAGTGDRKNYYSNKISSLKNTFLLGYIEDIENLYRAIDINVLTSISESFPYALLEGGLNKKVTIATSVGGIPEMIEDKKTGLLIDIYDYKKLSDLIIDLSKNGPLRKEYGLNLKNKIEKDFSAKAMAKRHIEIYNHILEQNKEE